MKKILVPTDFSDNALKAAYYAAEVASVSGAALILFHAAEMGHDSFYQPVSMYEKYNNLVLDEDRSLIENLHNLLQSKFPNISITTHIEPEQETVDAVCNYSSKNGIDLIIMGTQGASGLKSVVIGTITASLISKSAIPVLAIPAEYMPEPPANILLATRKYEENIELVSKIADFVTAFSGTLHVGVFLDRNHDDAADYVSNMAKLNEYVEYLKGNFPVMPVEGRILEGESLEHSLELYGLQHNISIIALISYPKSFFENLFQKSTTRKMAFHSQIPVLAIPAVETHAQ